LTTADGDAERATAIEMLTRLPTMPGAARWRATGAANHWFREIEDREY
jgi:hypothetical protein